MRVKRKIYTKIYRFLVKQILNLILIILFFSSCVGTKLSHRTWSAAFEDMHKHISKNYPFIEWKNINLDSLYAVTAPQIKKAEEQQNKEDYYLALRRYVFNFCDQHMFIAGEDFGLRERNISGSFGMGIIKLDNGTYIVHYISENGAARKAGIEWGAEITQWNDIDIHDAVTNTSVLWAERPQATNEGKSLEQCRYLLRAPVGTEAKITLLNPGTDTEKHVILKAQKDHDLADLINTSTSKPPSASAFGSRIDSKILPQGTGYIKIKKFMPSMSHWRLYNSFKKALKSMIKAKVDGIIIDVRGNEGGLDSLVPKMCGHFVTEDDFYEYVSFYNPEIDSFEIDPDATLTISPLEPHYDGKIVVLTDKNTVSTAEGLPMVVQRLDNGIVMGQFGTAGSFAMGAIPAVYKLPEGVVIGFLKGRSLDKNKNIQIDSDANGNGGVIPDIRVPLTYKNIYQQYYENRDVILETAIDYIKNENDN